MITTTWSLTRSVAVLGLAAAAVATAQVPEAPPPRKVVLYYPTEVGTRWTYRNGDRDETFVVTGVERKDGARVLSVGREFEGGIASAQEVRVLEA